MADDWLQAMRIMVHSVRWYHPKPRWQAASLVARGSTMSSADRAPIWQGGLEVAQNAHRAPKTSTPSCREIQDLVRCDSSGCDGEDGAGLPLSAVVGAAQ